mmetsp:Transcript_19860/g.55254  ORF Transcript_19860/g.55254 Transcript_19860/m.55254 type:complete len:122 (+) Transcript_19860:1637-2002(+)
MTPSSYAVLVPQDEPYPYLHISHKRSIPCHRAVCEAFYSPNPPSKPHVAHLNGDPCNNTPGNLRWISPAENRVNQVREPRDKARPCRNSVWPLCLSPRGRCNLAGKGLAKRGRDGACAASA